MGPSGPETWWENRPNLVNRLFPYWESERVTVCWTLSLSLFTSLSLSLCHTTTSTNTDTFTRFLIFESVHILFFPQSLFLSVYVCDFSLQSSIAVSLFLFQTLSTWSHVSKWVWEWESERENKDAVRDVDAFAQMRGIFYKSYDSYSLLSYDEPRISNSEEIVT